MSRLKKWIHGLEGLWRILTRILTRMGWIWKLGDESNCGTPSFPTARCIDLSFRCHIFSKSPSMYAVMLSIQFEIYVYISLLILCCLHHQTEKTSTRWQWAFVHLAEHYGDYLRSNYICYYVWKNFFHSLQQSWNWASRWCMWLLWIPFMYYMLNLVAQWVILNIWSIHDTICRCNLMNIDVIGIRVGLIASTNRINIVNIKNGAVTGLICSIFRFCRFEKASSFMTFT